MIPRVIRPRACRPGFLQPPPPRLLQSRTSQSATHRRPVLLQHHPSLRPFSQSAPPLRQEPFRPQTEQPPSPTKQQQPDPEPEPEPEPEPDAQQSGPGPRRRRRRRLLSAAAFLLVGVSLGSSIRLFAHPPPPPEPGTPADAAEIARIRALAEALPLVQALEADPAIESWDAYEGFVDAGRQHLREDNVTAATTASGLAERGAASDDDDAAAADADEQQAHHRRFHFLRRPRITKGALGGSRGVGAFQRIFHNASTGDTTSVIWFGSGTAGWPGIVHGGATATIVDESLGRCAVRRLPGGTGVTANLRLTYLRPVSTNRFHVVRCAPVPEGDLPASERDKAHRKVWVRAVVETLDGRPCVEAEGLFVAPKGLKLNKINERF